MAEIVTVEVEVEKPVDHVWQVWTKPEHIVNWNFAIDEWHCPSAQNDLSQGGKFSWRMEAKDGSFGFDYSGTYRNVVPNELIELSLEDDRSVKIEFQTQNNSTRVVESFEVEEMNGIEQQQAGWKSILNNFKKYAESL